MMLPTVILGLAVALCWGSADTLATFFTRRLGTAATTLIAQVVGLVLAAGVTLLVGLPALSARDLTLSILFGMVLGVVAALAYLTLYRALALGPLAITSPLVSGQGGVTLLLAVVWLREPLAGWPLVCLLVTGAGILLSATNGHEVQHLALRTLLSPGVAMALVSMLCFGVFAFGLMQAATVTTWLLVVLWSRVFSCLFLSILLRSPTDHDTTGARSRQHLLAWVAQPWWEAWM
jgi:drug/metabolite transporter (DMT)-like permease